MQFNSMHANNFTAVNATKMFLEYDVSAIFYAACLQFYLESNMAFFFKCKCGDVFCDDSITEHYRTF